MKTPRLSEIDLQSELNDFHDRCPKLGDDELFVLWFRRAFVAEDEATVTSALCGGQRDKGVDAVLIDDPALIVFVVPGKHRQKIPGFDLARSVCKGPRAGVLVRVICVPRSPNQHGNGLETLVSRIVLATNWQNAIRQSDLMSNDRREIEIESQPRKLYYIYLRKALDQEMTK